MCIPGGHRSFKQEVICIPGAKFKRGRGWGLWFVREYRDKHALLIEPK